MGGPAAPVALRRPSTTHEGGAEEERARTHGTLDITVLLSGFSQARDGRHRSTAARGLAARRRSKRGRHGKKGEREGDRGKGI